MDQCLPQLRVALADHDRTDGVTAGDDTPAEIRRATEATLADRVMPA